MAETIKAAILSESKRDPANIAVRGYRVDADKKVGVGNLIGDRELFSQLASRETAAISAAQFERLVDSVAADVLQFL